ncbi:Vitamin B12 transporter BtuB [bacterium HR08]|nr:Vitamin B12 transporter BtuB [bacterium HR08]
MRRGGLLRSRLLLEIVVLSLFIGGIPSLFGALWRWPISPQGRDHLAFAASSRGVLEGRITDPLGAVIPGASVTLLRDGRMLAQVRSDENGRYRFADVVSGLYQLRVERQGFAPREIRDIFLPAGAVRVLDVMLSVGPLREEIVVTATATEVPRAQLGASVGVVEEEDLQRQAKVHVLELLRIIPGLHVAQTGGRGGQTSLFLRGGNSSFTKVLLDGAPINQIGGFFDFSTLMGTQIERIEVMRNPNSVLYGSDATSGVIQLFTRRSREYARIPTFGYAIEGGSYRSLRQEASLRGAVRTFDYASSFSRYDTDNHLPNHAYHNGTYVGNFGWQPNVASEVRLVLRHTVMALGTPNALDFYGIPDDSAMRGRETYVVLSGRHHTTRRWQNQIRFASVHSLSRFTNPAPTGEPFDPFGFGPVYLGAPVTIVGGNGFRVSGRAILDFGGSYPQTFVTDTVRQSLWAQSDVRVGEAFTGTFGFRYENERGRSGTQRVDRDNFSYILQGQYNWAARVFVTAGVGVEDNAVFGVEANPRVSVASVLRRGEPTSWWNETKLRFYFGTGIKEPNIFQEGSSLFAVLRGLGASGEALIARFRIAPIGPERNRSFDLGLEQNFARNRARLSLALFHNRFEDVIEFLSRSALLQLGVPVEVAQATPFGANVNAQTFRARGAEVELTADVGHGLMARGTYTYLDARILRSFSSDALRPTFNPAFPGIPIGAFAPLVGARPFQRAPHTGSLLLAWSRSRWSLVLIGSFVGRRDTSTFLSDPFFGPSMLLPNRNLNPGYQKLDLSAHYRVHERVTLVTVVENVLNRRYTEVFGYPAPKLNFRAGARVTWGGVAAWRDIFR